MTFQVTMMSGLGFMSFFVGYFEFFHYYYYYDRLIGILFLGFLAANFNFNFRFQTSEFGLQSSEIRSPH